MKVRCAFAGAILLWLAAPGFAHRLDEYLQATIVTIEPDKIRLHLNLVPGVEVADQVIALLDRDGDGAISAKEAASYAALLKRDLTVQLDNRDVQLNCAASNSPAPAELRTGSGIIEMEFVIVSVSLIPGAHTLTLENRHLPKISVYLLNAAKPKAGSIQIATQKRNENQSAGNIAFTLEAAAPKEN
jgi:hypothetical protein